MAEISLIYQKAALARRRTISPAVQYLNDFSHIHNNTHVFKMNYRIINKHYAYVCRDITEFFPNNFPNLEFTKEFCFSFLADCTVVYIEYFGDSLYKEYSEILTPRDVFRKLDCERINYRDFKNEW